MARQPHNLKPAWPYTINPRSKQRNGIVCWWPCDPAGGATVYDLSGRGKHATWHNGATNSAGGWTEGNNGGRAMRFDGTDDYAEVVSALLLRPALLTVSCWVKLNAYTADAYFVSYGAATTNGYHLGTYNGAGPNNFMTFFGGAGHNLVYSTTVPTLGKWYHLATTYDGTNQRIYVNGKIENTVAQTAFVAPTGNMFFGKRADAANYINGAMEDVRLYNYPLRAAEMLALYQLETRQDLRLQPNRGQPQFLADPTAIWPGYDFSPLESSIVPRLRGERARADRARVRPSMADMDPLALADLQLSADRYVSADANELMRQLFGRPRSNFWKEPMQAAVDDQALTVPNPEQEQSKFVEYETASRALFYKRWLQSTFWHEPMQSRIDPVALTLIDPVDATYGYADTQDIQPHAAFRANDRRRHFSSTFGQTDPVTLALEEHVSADKFTCPWQMRFPSRPPTTYTGGDSINEPSLIPEDPPSLLMRSWWTALAEPVRLPVSRWPRHFYPVGTLDLDEAQRPETIYQAFEGPWRSPRWTRPIRGHFYPFGDLGIDNADRPEHISIDEFRRLFDEPMRARVRILAGQVAVAALLVEPSTAGETITVDKYQRPFDVPRGKAELWRGLMQIAVSEYDATTFSQPPIVRFIRSMLNAGF